MDGEIAKRTADPGLSEAEIQASRAQHGANILAQIGRKSRWSMLARQFSDVLVLILLAGAALSAMIGQAADAAVIVAIVLLNGLLGFAQEWRAERSLALLEQMLAQTCTVRRGGSEVVVAAEDVVVGDVVLLAAGDRVPADMTLHRAVALRTDESALTGESLPVDKTTADVETGKAFMGTNVVAGHGEGVVTAVGMATAFGDVARLTQGIDRQASPLQRQLARLGAQLAAAAVLVAGLVLLLGLLQGRSFAEMIMTGISLAVAVVPEGLPAVVTVTLAFGVRAMVRRRVLLRRLQAAEAMGAASVICTDKTGTLTRNEMVATTLLLPERRIEFEGTGYAPIGRMTEGGMPVDADADIVRALRVGRVCTHARVKEEDGLWRARGAATESAILVAAMKAGVPAPRCPVLREWPFDSDRKRMSVVIQEREACFSLVKGAPEVLLDRCTSIRRNGEVAAFDEIHRAAERRRIEDLEGEGRRVLCLAERILDCGNAEPEDAESGLTLLGAIGMIDPARTEARGAVADCVTAGIRIVMITGDAGPTAVAVAREVGLFASDAVDGAALANLPDDALLARIDEGAVFARTKPADKMRLVRALQARGDVVCMTGDGVNDAPALKAADVGVAMGIRGTDVAKGAADVIVTDDNFASIVAGVREGRRQFDNIVKFVRYLLSSNAGEVVLIVTNLAIGGPLVLLPVQILWMNLVTDGLSALALGFEPEEEDVMNRPPRPAVAFIVNRGAALGTLAIALYIGLASLWVFQSTLSARGLVEAQTLAFTTMVMLEKFNVFGFRTLRVPLLKAGFLGNPLLMIAVGSTILVQIAAVYAPPLQAVLHTTALTMADWLLVAALGLPLLAGHEVRKVLAYRRK